MQLCWNDFSNVAGGELVARAGDPTVAGLNRREVDRSVIDPESYVAVTGVGPGTVKHIREELAKKFGGRARPRAIPREEEIPPNFAVAYCYLFKNLEFQIPFQRIERSETFLPAVYAFDPTPMGNDPEHLKMLDELPVVECFGISGHSIPSPEKLSQVKILHYRTKNGGPGFPEEFIVELATKKADDRVILAAVRPAATLGETVKKVDGLIAASQPVAMLVGDELDIPKINFDITRDYTEIKTAVTGVRKLGMTLPWIIIKALQNTRFQMDERGVRLRSDATMVGGCGAEPPPRQRHWLVFYKPFLLMLKRRDASAPYFVLWVDNAELLVKGRRR
jgi:hypothetical protein